MPRSMEGDSAVSCTARYPPLTAAEVEPCTSCTGRTESPGRREGGGGGEEEEALIVGQAKRGALSPLAVGVRCDAQRTCLERVWQCARVSPAAVATSARPASYKRDTAGRCRCRVKSEVDVGTAHAEQSSAGSAAEGEAEAEAEAVAAAVLCGCVHSQPSPATPPPLVLTRRSSLPSRPLPVPAFSSQRRCWSDVDRLRLSLRVGCVQVRWYSYDGWAELARARALPRWIAHLTASPPHHSPTPSSTTPSPRILATAVSPSVASRSDLLSPHLLSGTSLCPSSAHFSSHLHPSRIMAALSSPMAALSPSSDPVQPWTKLFKHGDGYPNDMLLAPVDDYECSTCCGRLLCQRRLQRVTQHSDSSSCPACRSTTSSSSSFIAQAFADRLIRALPIRCPRQCDVSPLTIGTGERTIVEHLTQSCPLRYVPCPNGCPVLLLTPAELSRHLTRSATGSWCPALRAATNRCRCRAPTGQTSPSRRVAAIGSALLH